MVSYFLDGFNATILAYGMSSSGKTSTLFGYKDNEGIIMKAIDDIFTKIQGTQFRCFTQFIEIYNENIKDLLTDSPSKIAILNGELQGAETVKIETKDQLLKLIQNSKKRRTTSETNLNQESSRSHAVLRIVISQFDQQNRRASGLPKQRSQKIHSSFTFVDLAGSERLEKTKAQGTKLKEANNINKSLLTLGLVINQLATKQQFISYRSSKLTHLLSNSLGGNCITTIIGCISPDKSHVEETISTMRFCSRAMKVANKAELGVKEEIREKQQTEELIMQNKKLKQQIKELQQQLNASYLSASNVSNSIDTDIDLNEISVILGEDVSQLGMNQEDLEKLDLDVQKLDQTIQAEQLKGIDIGTSNIYKEESFQQQTESIQNCDKSIQLIEQKTDEQQTSIIIQQDDGTQMSPIVQEDISTSPKRLVLNKEEDQNEIEIIQQQQMLKSRTQSESNTVLQSPLCQVTNQNSLSSSSLQSLSTEQKDEEIQTLNDKFQNYQHIIQNIQRNSQQQNESQLDILFKEQIIRIINEVPQIQKLSVGQQDILQQLLSIYGSEQLKYQEIQNVNKQHKEECKVYEDKIYILQQQLQQKDNIISSLQDTIQLLRNGQQQQTQQDEMSQSQTLSFSILDHTTIPTLNNNQSQQSQTSPKQQLQINSFNKLQSIKTDLSQLKQDIQTNKNLIQTQNKQQYEILQQNCLNICKLFIKKQSLNKDQLIQIKENINNYNNTFNQQLQNIQHLCLNINQKFCSKQQIKEQLQSINDIKSKLQTLKYDIKQPLIINYNQQLIKQFVNQKEIQQLNVLQQQKQEMLQQILTEKQSNINNKLDQMQQKLQIFNKNSINKQQILNVKQQIINIKQDLQNVQQFAKQFKVIQIVPNIQQLNQQNNYQTLQYGQMLLQATNIYTNINTTYQNIKTYKQQFLQLQQLIKQNNNNQQLVLEQVNDQIAKLLQQFIQIQQQKQQNIQSQTKEQIQNIKQSIQNTKIIQQQQKELMLQQYNEIQNQFIKNNDNQQLIIEQLNIKHNKTTSTISNNKQQIQQLKQQLQSLKEQVQTQQSFNNEIYQQLSKNINDYQECIKNNNKNDATLNIIQQFSQQTKYSIQTLKDTLLNQKPIISENQMQLIKNKLQYFKEQQQITEQDEQQIYKTIYDELKEVHTQMQNIKQLINVDYINQQLNNIQQNIANKVNSEYIQKQQVQQIKQQIKDCKQHIFNQKENINQYLQNTNLQYQQKLQNKLQVINDQYRTKVIDAGYQKSQYIQLQNTQQVMQTRIQNLEKDIKNTDNKIKQFQKLCKQVNVNKYKGKINTLLSNYELSLDQLFQQLLIKINKAMQNQQLNQQQKIQLIQQTKNNIVDIKQQIQNIKSDIINNQIDIDMKVVSTYIASLGENFENQLDTKQEEIITERQKFLRLQQDSQIKIRQIMDAAKQREQLLKQKAQEQLQQIINQYNNFNKK